MPVFPELPEMPPGLLDKVLCRIRREERVSALKRISVFSAGFFGSAVVLIPAFQAARADFVQSGFSHFISLIFSDPGIVVSFWNEFVFSILESLPVLSVIFLLVAIFVFLGSARMLAKNMAFLNPKFINN